MSKHAQHTNHLSQETSPYLQQHAHNPVDWYPWNWEALDKARREDKPIFLSIGYSACHWCHVMAHESFEDPQAASVLNELFVNIKVDREERPDLDKIYQTAHQLLNQRGGGWPLSMVLTPETQTPFFAGTYFPPAPRHGMPAFSDLMRRVAAFYREHREDINKQNAALIHALGSMNAAQGGEDIEIGAAPLAVSRRQLGESFDDTFGGFGDAPKFPHPSHIEFLLRYWAHSINDGAVEPDAPALNMALFTLKAMASGGLYDQLGGGFCRYSVDQRWMIPHFEKMLYDNGPLLALYAQAWAATGDPLYKRIATETAQWAMREMQSSEGGYYSTLDADSEGHEGKFYAWTREQVRSLLDEEEYRIIARRFGLDQYANFEGAWHLYVREDIATLARELDLPEARVTALLDGARQKLFEARRGRVYPGRDEKILTAWNGLMIKGMAIAGRLLGTPEFIDSAEQALDFIRSALWKDNRLLAAYKDGKAHLSAYLDDYVFVIDAILELQQARWREGDLDFAIELAEVLLAYFEDPQQGGFFFTAADHEKLLYRPKPMADDATPSGNGAAACVLGRLGYLLGESRYLDAAQRTIKAAWPEITRMPYAYNTLLTAVEEYLYPPQNIVLRGKPDQMQAWHARAAASYSPRRLMFAIPAETRGLPGALAERAASEGVIAYLCSGHVCAAPIKELDEFDAALKCTESRL